MSSSFEMNNIILPPSGVVSTFPKFKILENVLVREALSSSPKFSDEVINISDDESSTENIDVDVEGLNQDLDT